VASRAAAAAAEEEALPAAETREDLVDSMKTQVAENMI
jgi:hypothetical protein